MYLYKQKKYGEFMSLLKNLNIGESLTVKAMEELRVLDPTDKEFQHFMSMMEVTEMEYSNKFKVKVNSTAVLGNDTGEMKYSIKKIISNKFILLGNEGEDIKLSIVERFLLAQYLFLGKF